METMLLNTLRQHGLPEPTLQYEVRDADGHLLGRVDAAIPTRASPSNTTASRSTRTSSSSPGTRVAATGSRPDDWKSC